MRLLLVAATAYFIVILYLLLPSDPSEGHDLNNPLNIPENAPFSVPNNVQAHIMNPYADFISAAFGYDYIGHGGLYKDDLFITAYHVIEGIYKPTIKTIKGETFTAEMACASKVADLALMRLDRPHGQKTYPIAKPPHEMDGVAVLPVGRDETYYGIVVNPIDIAFVEGELYKVTNTTVIGYPGVSGSIAFNDASEIVGVVIAGSYYSTGLVPVDVLQSFLPALEECIVLREAMRDLSSL